MGGHICRAGIAAAPGTWDRLPSSGHSRPAASPRDTDIVDADPSVYNMLWSNHRVAIIDFPQAVDATTNPDAFDLLRKDVNSVAHWFERLGARSTSSRCIRS
jgi:hypothetical protein